MILSHGYGQSKYIASKGWLRPPCPDPAGRGIAVLLLPHASSRVGGLAPGLPQAAFFWRERVAEMRAIFDQLPEIERQARPSKDGGTTTGSRWPVTRSGAIPAACCSAVACRERISPTRASCLLATLGRCGADLTAEHAKRFPFCDVDFSGLRLQTLVVCGTEENPHFTPRDPEWHADVFHDAPGADALLTIDGVGHALGGLQGLTRRKSRQKSPTRWRRPGA